MGKKSTPEPPDYEAAAERQADASREITTQQTWANRPNQTTPWGNISWDATNARDPATGQMITQWAQNLELTPELQAALSDQQTIQALRSDLAMNLMGRSAEEFGPMTDWSQFEQVGATPDVPDYQAMLQQAPGLTSELDFSGAHQVGDPSEIRQRAEDAIYGRMSSRLDPQWQQREEQIQTQLRNQGLVPGTQAYNDAYQLHSQGRNDAYQAAMNEAIMGGGLEADRMFGQDMSLRGQDVSEIMASAGFGNQARAQSLSEMLRAGQTGFSQNMQAANYQNQVRQQQIAEEMQRRGWSLNEINAILHGQQVAQPSMPNFNQATKSETPQYLQAADMGFNAEMDVFNANQAAAQGMMSGITGMAGAFMPMSDRRLKENVVKIGEGPLFSRYRWDWTEEAIEHGFGKQENEGVIADEVFTKLPEAVSFTRDGYMSVNYALVEAAEARHAA